LFLVRYSSFLSIVQKSVFNEKNGFLGNIWQKKQAIIFIFNNRVT